MGRQLGLSGESVFYIGDDGLRPVAQWDLRTRDGVPSAYRLTLPDVAGGRSFTALAGEVLHIRVGSTAEAPWRGTAPLMRASLTAGLLHAIESALSDVYADSPLGSQVVPIPEDPNISNEQLARSFRPHTGACDPKAVDHRKPRRAPFRVIPAPKPPPKPAYPSTSAGPQCARTTAPRGAAPLV